MMMSDNDDDYSHSVLTWGCCGGLCCGGLSCGGSIKALGCALGSVSLSLLVWHEEDFEALSGSLSCQGDRIRTLWAAVPSHKIINELGRIKWTDFSVQKFNLRRPSENKFVSLFAFFGFSAPIWKIESGAGKSDSVLAFFVRLELDRTLGFWKVCGTIINIGIVGKGISRREHNPFHPALSLGTGVV